MNNTNESRPLTDDELYGVVGGATMATKFLAEQWGGRAQAGRYRRINRTVARQSIGPGAGSPPLFPRASAGGGGACGPTGCSV